MSDYNANLGQLKRKILKMIDQDRKKAIEFYQLVNTQLNQHPEAVLLVGDKAVDTLDNLRKHATNMIKMYQIQKRKIGQKEDRPKDIQRILKQIQQGDKKDK